MSSEGKLGHTQNIVLVIKGKLRFFITKRRKNSTQDSHFQSNKPLFSLTR